MLHALPIFGQNVAKTWLWTVDLSLGFIGQGMIIGPAISLHMLLGAIVGWGILSPYAKHRGWAPGEVDDWSTGSRGWIIWVSLASLFADASIKLAWFILRPVWERYLASGYVSTQITAFWKIISSRQSLRPDESQYTPIPEESQDESSQIHNRFLRRDSWFRVDSLVSRKDKDDSFDGVATSRLQALGFLVSVLICALAVHLVFGNIIRWYLTILAIALSLPMAMVGIRCIAETDYNPDSALGIAPKAIMRGSAHDTI